MNKVLKFANVFIKCANRLFPIDLVNELDAKKRYHFSIGQDPKISYIPRSLHNYKPQGFWYGFGGNWAVFLSREYGLETMAFEYNYIYEVTIGDESKILKIQNSLNQEIDWKKIAMKYCGVEGFFDIKSGCIWNPECGVGLKLVYRKTNNNIWINELGTQYGLGQAFYTPPPPQPAKVKKVNKSDIWKDIEDMLDFLMSEKGDSLSVAKRVVENTPSLAMKAESCGMSKSHLINTISYFIKTRARSRTNNYA